MTGLPAVRQVGVLAASEGSGRQPCLVLASTPSCLGHVRELAERAPARTLRPLPGPRLGLSPDLLLRAQPEEGV